ncbi:MAG TPA: hypothetical protein VFL67_10445 [Mycobacterium sp.]|nr:hypothetical protein [Mycobacterium sp.]
MIYGHVVNGTIDSIGQPPALAFDGARWWDLRDLSPSVLATNGWYPVLLAQRPVDDATTTYDPVHAFSVDQITQSWVARPKTAAEIAADTALTNRATIEAQAATALSTNATFLAIASPTAAQVATQTKALTRQSNGVIRLLLNRLEATT